MRSSPSDSPLPARFADWFAARGWEIHPHQRAMLAAHRAGQDTLLIAPTGGGKTLAGFLPALVDLAETGSTGRPHTLYVSPLKALAVDIARNLEAPIQEMGLAVTAQTRTGDTPQAKRQRQRAKPPDMLLTTPESLALMLSQEDARGYFADLGLVIVDEIHALAGGKRGDQLALCLGRLSALAPGSRRVGLSATVADPGALQRWLARGADPARVRLIEHRAAAAAEIEILTTQDRMPWSGHMGLHVLGAVHERLRAARTAIVFVNTRAQAEMVFQELWRLNDDNLAIALHHGSLAREQRRKVEAAMARGDLRAVVATSSLDLGIDWAAVDLVIQIGAPKGTSRLIQRIGRANHRLDEPSRAVLAPANRFEVLECRAALEGARAGELDGEPPRPGGLDVLAQHVLLSACAGPIDPDALFAEVTGCGPYADLTRRDFDDVVGFVADGGYALGAYERWKRLFRRADGLYEVADKDVRRRARMNVGTIVEAATLKIRLNRGPVLGEVEEYFVNGLVPGDTFIFAGRLLRFERLRDNWVEASPARGQEPKIPAYAGGRLPLSTYLAERVRALLADPTRWADLPGQVAEWLRLQAWRSVLPGRDDLLVETFPRGRKRFLVAYCFEGRNAHQTLGMLLTRRMERMGAGPIGFVATDYVIAVWSLREVASIPALFDADMLGDDLEAWMDESSMLKRTFRRCAVIAGLIEPRLPGAEKSGRQVTFNADLIYDVLRRHEPDHVLLRATRADAAGGLTDVKRLAEMLTRVQGRVIHRALERVSPLAVPVLLEVGREQVAGGTLDELLDDAAEDLIAEAIRPNDPAQLPLD